MNNKANKQKGFTIIELMIATTIFGFILLVASVAVIAIGRIYHKAIVSSRTQDVTRSVIDDIGQSLQFSGTSVSSTDPNNPNPLKAICFGQDRYTYQVDNYIIDSRPADSVGLYRTFRSDQSQCVPQTSGGEELLANNMRLLNLAVSPSTPHKIQVKIAYGENDLLTTYEDNGDRNTVPINEAECRSGIRGGIFCDVAELETVVTKRIQ